jgi:hypothetical protein
MNISALPPAPSRGSQSLLGTIPDLNHIPPLTLEAQTDLERLITWTAAIAATHHDWHRLRQLFIAAFAAERMTVEFPELVTESTLLR